FCQSPSSRGERGPDAPSTAIRGLRPEDLQVRLDRAREGVEVVAAFEETDEPARGMPCRPTANDLSHTRVAGLGDERSRERVVAMGVEPGRDEDQLRAERVDGMGERSFE